ncbi:MAG: hypothetical protein ACRDV4_05130, partial [Acidimicrobiales bacterium]
YGPYLVDGLPALGEVGELNFPSAIAVDPEGDLYLADGEMHTVRIVPAFPMKLLGKVAQADDMYTVAGALSVGSLHNMTSWVQTRLVDPSGLVLSPGDRLIYSDAGADVVRELPAHT